MRYTICKTSQGRLSMNIENHDLSLCITPDEHVFQAKDTVRFSGVCESVDLHLGNRCTLQKAYTKNGETPFEVVHTHRHTTVYRFQNLNSDSLTLEYDGLFDRFKGYGVCTIHKHCVELSGFGFFFPTIEENSQFERFTYSLEVSLPKSWRVVAPDDRDIQDVPLNERRFHYQKHKIEDILICAAPDYQRHYRKNMTMILPNLEAPVAKSMLKDFEHSVDVCAETFGELRSGMTTTGIVSPRGEGSQEWGYERGHLWVIGDLFLQYACAHEWRFGGLKKSLALHETIHSWIGIGVSMPIYLAEAITQYCEVVLTHKIYQEDDLDRRYFAWYEKRLLETLKEKDLPPASLKVTDDHYAFWYLKGSLAFYDLEKRVGRDSLLAAFKDLYQNHHGTFLDEDAVRVALERSLDLPLKDFFNHWMHSTGYEPLH